MVATMIDKRLGFPEMDVAGQALKKLRQSRRWSQEELARQAGMTMNALSKLERGLHSPSRQTLRGLAEAFKMSEDELEGKLKGATVDVALSREAFDHASKEAGERGMPVGKWIEETILPTTILLKRPIAPAAEDSEQREARQPPRRPRRRANH